MNEILKTKIKSWDQTPGWKVFTVINEDNMTYIVANEAAKEALVVDPVEEDWSALIEVTQSLKGYRFLAVIDTHTHADHISCAAKLSDTLQAPLLMHEKSPSRKIHLRVSRDFNFPSMAAPFKILMTPGHTPDSITPIWGSFIFSGDTLLYGDTGRDDLPGGNPKEHFESMQKIKKQVKPDFFLLPWHDAAGGRITPWAHQLEVNPSLTQNEENFVKEAGAYVGPSPKLLKESLFENFK